MSAPTLEPRTTPEVQPSAAEPPSLPPDLPPPMPADIARAPSAPGARATRPLATVIGAALLVAGGLLLIAQMTGWAFWPFGWWLSWDNGWPLIVMGTGLVLLVMMFAGGPEAAGLAVPGSVVTTTGLILLCDNALNLWQTWAYAWALVVPASAGVGLWLQGRWSGRQELQARGRRLAETGVVLFVAGAVFFELVLNLSGFFAGGMDRFVVPALLIGLGLYLLLRRNGRQAAMS